MAFEELNLHPDLIRAVEAQGWQDPTPIQQQAIPPILEGRDVLGAAQTGSGKTGAFVLFLFHHLLTDRKPGPRVLVLVPTRELAAQVDETFTLCSTFAGFKVATIIGGVGYDQQRRAVAAAQARAGAGDG